MKLKTVIADDEPLARERLKHLLSSDEDIVVVGECRNGREVVSTLKHNSVDVLFLDIQMPGRGGFDAIKQIGVANMPVTVFVTAHNQFALRAFEVHALDYLTKPVEPERLQSTLLRVKDRVASQSALVTQEQLKSLVDALEGRPPSKVEYPQRLLVPNGAKDLFVNTSDIEWIEAADYYACLHVKDKNLLIRDSIKQLASILDPNKFVRIHRSAIVSVDHVREIIREGRSSEGTVILTSGHRLRMSKAGWQNLLAVSHR